MAATSVAIPPVATAVRAAGRLRHRDARPRPRKAAIDAVILDRDGTIVEDVPYNGDPAQVRPAEGAQHACARLRDLGVAVMIASNQSGVARGLLTTRDVERVNARVGELLGPFTATLVCPHGPDDGCACRKPAAGLVLRAASIAQTRPDRCVVIGDCAADVGAAQAAGAVGILVPNAATRAEEIADAPLVADDLETAVDYVVAMGTR
jgi:histidinol-phosphate phosphatase family protein